MANINIKFNNKDYLVSCDDGQEEDLKNLTKFLDKKYSNLKEKLGNIGENKLLLITAIKTVDDYFDLMKKLNITKKDFQELSDKFKELKSLAINYKDTKELEIKKIKEELSELQTAVERSKNSYEEILDKTTRSIEKFIQDVDEKAEKNIQ